jgi:hypothetical protein
VREKDLRKKEAFIKDQKIYLIDWVDSLTNTGWKHSDELTGQLALCQTVGFYVNDTKEFITLALNRDLTGANSPYGELMSIPKVSIKRKRILKV